MSASDIYGVEDISFNQEELGPWHDAAIVEPAFHQSRRFRRTFDPLDWAPIQLPQILPNVENLDDEILSPQTQSAVNTLGPNHLLEEAAGIAEDIGHLEATQAHLLNQLQELEEAHAQLEYARLELVELLMSMEEGAVAEITPELSNPTRRMMQSVLSHFGQSAEVPESNQDEDDNQIDFRYIQSLRGIESFHEVEHNSELLLRGEFLDANGEPCKGIFSKIKIQGYEECLSRAVGWVKERAFELEYGLDRNGNFLDDDQVAAFFSFSEIFDR
jgi:hypothetical protein